MCRSFEELEGSGSKRILRRCRLLHPLATRQKNTTNVRLRRRGKAAAIKWAAQFGDPSLIAHLGTLSPGRACHTAVYLGLPPHRVGMVMPGIEFGFPADDAILRELPTDFENKDFQKRFKDARKGWTQTQQDWANKVNEGGFDYLFDKMANGEELTRADKDWVTKLSALVQSKDTLEDVIHTPRKFEHRSNGTPILDENGNPKWIFERDENGSVIYDEDDDPIIARHSFVEKRRVHGEFDEPTVLYTSLKLDELSDFGDVSSPDELLSLIAKHYPNGSTQQVRSFIKATHDPAEASRAAAKDQNNRFAPRFLAEISTRNSMPMRGRKVTGPDGVARHGYAEILDTNESLVVRSVRKTRVPVEPGSKETVEAYVVQMVERDLVDDRTQNEETLRRWAILRSEKDVQLPAGGTLPKMDKGIRAQNQRLPVTWRAKDGTFVWRHPDTGVVYARDQWRYTYSDSWQDATPFTGAV